MINASINDLEYEYFQLGKPRNALNDLRSKKDVDYASLIARNTYPADSLNDALYKYYEALGRGMLLSAPLATSLIALKGTGTPTYTRASPATVIDHEGVVRLCKSGEARMQGVRRVENRLAASEDLTNALWTKNAGATVTPLGSGVFRVTFGATAGSGVYQLEPVGSQLASGLVALAQCELMQDGAITGTVEICDPTTTGAELTVVTLTTGWVKSSWKRTIGGVPGSGLWVRKGTTGVTSVLMRFPQLENVTGQAIQTPAEYVPVGTGGPNFGPDQIVNGANITSITGWTGGGGAALSTSNGALVITNSGAAEANAGQAFSVSVGKTYLIKLDVIAASNNCLVQLGGFAATPVGVGAGRVVFITALNTTGFYIRTNSPVSGHSVSVTNVSVTECLFSGANVDGVKYFDTKLDGSAITKTATTGYLNEPQRTNGFSYSEQFENGVWPKTYTTANANTGLGQSGELTADRINLSVGASITCYFTQNAVCSAGTVTVSGWITPGLIATKFGFRENTSSGAYAVFDLTGAGSVIATLSTVAKIYPAKFGAYRFEITYTASAGTLQQGFYFLPASYTSGSPHSYAWTSDGTGYATVWGFQIEPGSTASTYIPTTTAAAVRAADSLAMPVAANASQGTFVVTVSAPGPDASSRQPGFALQGASTSDAIYCFLDPSFAPLYLRIKSGGVVGFTQTLQASTAANTAYKIAVSWNNGRIAWCVNGGTVGSATGITLPTALSNMVTNNPSSSGEWLGTIGNPQVYSQALPDALLKTLTA